MDDKLKEIFAIVNEMVKFSEAKNAILIAFNGSAILGILKIISDGKFCSSLINYYMYIFVAFAIIGLLFSLISFFPRVKIPCHLSSGEANPNDNLLLYTDICKYDENTYLESLAESMNEPITEHCQFKKFYANQIIINSTIALRKYKLFHKALWCTLSAICTPVIALLVFAILED